LKIKCRKTSPPRKPRSSSACADLRKTEDTLKPRRVYLTTCIMEQDQAGNYTSDEAEYLTRHSWKDDAPKSLKRKISPPPPQKTRSTIKGLKTTLESANEESQASPSTAAFEGELKIRDHLEYFSVRFASASKPPRPARLPIEAFRDLYMRSQDCYGHHFRHHQHGHPVAGTHYDLRLQINVFDSASWAVMYGDSKWLNRNATETRVHRLWNHLIETASNATGSMLIWDTGEYEILPPNNSSKETDDEGEAAS
jgi:hypothetical protein